MFPVANQHLHDINLWSIHLCLQVERIKKPEISIISEGQILTKYVIVAVPHATIRPWSDWNRSGEDRKSAWLPECQLWILANTLTSFAGGIQGARQILYHPFCTRGGSSHIDHALQKYVTDLQFWGQIDFLGDVRCWSSRALVRRWNASNCVVKMLLAHQS